MAWLTNEEFRLFGADELEGFERGFEAERLELLCVVVGEQPVPDMASQVAERGTSAGVGTVWTFLDRCGLTFKKRPRTPASRTGRTSRESAKRGSTASPSSTRRA